MTDVFGVDFPCAGRSFFGEISDIRVHLAQLARQAAARAYCPYSGFRVGAALLGKSGKIYTGSNVENGAFSPSLCAERTAFAKAVSEGERGFVMIAIAGGKDGVISGICPPCGVCRQVMQEFCSPDFSVLLAKADGFDEYALSDLLPLGFTL